MSKIDDVIATLSEEEVDLLLNDPEMLAEFKAKYAEPLTPSSMVTKIKDVTLDTLASPFTEPKKMIEKVLKVSSAKEAVEATKQATPGKVGISKVLQEEGERLSRVTDAAIEGMTETEFAQKYPTIAGSLAATAATIKMAGGDLTPSAMAENLGASAIGPIFSEMSQGARNLLIKRATAGLKPGAVALIKDMGDEFLEPVLKSADKVIDITPQEQKVIDKVARFISETWDKPNIDSSSLLDETVTIIPKGYDVNRIFPVALKKVISIAGKTGVAEKLAGFASILSAPWNPLGVAGTVGVGLDMLLKQPPVRNVIASPLTKFLMTSGSKIPAIGSVLAKNVKDKIDINSLRQELSPIAKRISEALKEK